MKYPPFPDDLTRPDDTLADYQKALTTDTVRYQIYQTSKSEWDNFSKEEKARFLALCDYYFFKYSLKSGEKVEVDSFQHMMLCALISLTMRENTPRQTFLNFYKLPGSLFCYGVLEYIRAKSKVLSTLWPSVGKPVMEKVLGTLLSFRGLATITDNINKYTAHYSSGEVIRYWLDVEMNLLKWLSK